MKEANHFEVPILGTVEEEVGPESCHGPRAHSVRARRAELAEPSRAGVLEEELQGLFDRVEPSARRRSRTRRRCGDTSR
jgi:hypothetical protein